MHFVFQAGLLATRSYSSFLWLWPLQPRSHHSYSETPLLTGDIQHPLFKSKSLPFITSNFRVSNLASFLQLLPRFYKTNVRSEFAAYATRPRIRARWDALQTEYSCCGGFNSGTGTQAFIPCLPKSHTYLRSSISFTSVLYHFFPGYTDWEGLDVEPLPIYAEKYFGSREVQAQVSKKINKLYRIYLNQAYFFTDF